MIKNFYNLDALVKISLHDKRENKWFKWKPAKRYVFGILKYPEGFYSFEHIIYSEEFLKSGKYLNADVKFIIENNKVYYKPHVKLFFSGNVSTDKEFETFEEALKFAKETKSKNSGAWLEIGEQ